MTMQELPSIARCIKQGCKARRVSNIMPLCVKHRDEIPLPILAAIAGDILHDLLYAKINRRDKP